MRDVAQRPETFVGKAEVEALFFFLGQPHAAQRVLRMIRRNAHAVVFIHGVAVGVAGGLRDPGSVAGAQDRLERGHQAAGRHRTLDAAGAMNVLVGFAIGYGEQAAAPQAALHEHAQALGSPIGFPQVAQAGFLRGGGARLGEAGGQARDFSGQGFEFALIRHVGRLRDGSHAQVLQPIRHAPQRTADAPAQRQQSHGDDQNGLDEDAR